jgi:hypothetical protein
MRQVWSVERIKVEALCAGDLAGDQFFEWLVNQAISGEEELTEWSGGSQGFDSATGALDDQGASVDIPNVDSGFKVAVGLSGCHSADVEGGGSYHAGFLDVFGNGAEDIQAV